MEVPPGVGDETATPSPNFYGAVTQMTHDATTIPLA